MTTESSIVDVADLGALFGSRARAAVLKVFVLDPQRPYYQRQIESATGLPLRAVQRELERLTSIGFLYRRLEGNRAYYQVDERHPMFPELRALMLKASSATERYRAALATEPTVLLAFADASGARYLIVTEAGASVASSPPEGADAAFVSMDQFLSDLESHPGTLAEYLKAGTDLLGRREDIVWRRIERAGFDVKKGEGVP